SCHSPGGNKGGRWGAGGAGALPGCLPPKGGASPRPSPPPPPGGAAAGRARHYLPRRGKATPSVLTFFALENDSRVLCYANANLTRPDQPGELMRFVEFWHGLTGSDPQWLYFDSRVAPYAELARVNERGIWFVTIRRRGAALVRRLRQLPERAWQRAVIDTPKRYHNTSATWTRGCGCATTPGRCGSWPWRGWATRSRRCS